MTHIFNSFLVVVVVVSIILLLSSTTNSQVVAEKQQQQQKNSFVAGARSACNVSCPHWVCDNQHNCSSSSAPYLCIFKDQSQQCSKAPPNPLHCPVLCCNTEFCHDADSCKVPCDAAVCTSHSRCPTESPFQCTSGKDASGCSAQASTWGPHHSGGSCTSCCDVNCCPGTGKGTACGFTTTTPPSPTSTPTCSKSDCSIPGAWCPSDLPFFCLGPGPATGGCLSYDACLSGACTNCCNTTDCPKPTPAPHPPNPWDNVPKSKNCTLPGSSSSSSGSSSSSSYGPAGAPNPAATPYGGIDVSALGCRAWVSESCCGYTPRFNWILSTCSSDPKKRKSQACRHKGANTTALKLRYIAAYQWDGVQWNKDDTSSTPIRPDGDLDLSQYRDGGASDDNHDWDLKYAPTTEVTGTQGLGPPAMMFVLSAKHISFAAFYALNQITLNRGPQYQDNCWGDSSGELDFLEVPFWADVELPINRWYLTTTADSGRCLPSQKNVPRFLNSQCSNHYCCEMCSCPNGTVCFGRLRDIGYTAMGCINASHEIPKNQDFVSFTVDGDNKTCGRHFGAVSGGATSNAYFEQGEDGDRDVIFVVVVDQDGTFVYRWHDSQTDVWPGIYANYSDRTISAPRPSPDKIKFGPPCPVMKKKNKNKNNNKNKTNKNKNNKKKDEKEKEKEKKEQQQQEKQQQEKEEQQDEDEYTYTSPCGIWEPSCPGDCPLISAGGNFGKSQVSGAYAVEAARDNLNWWDNFESTQSIKDFTPKHLPLSEKIKIIIPPLPYNCSHHPTEETCNSSSRCPGSAPYMCSKGEAYGGCAGNIPNSPNSGARFWPLSPFCEACVNISMCFFKCIVCPSSLCAPFPMCPHELPYTCTAGTSKHGCSNSSSFWGEQPWSDCSSCCYCPGAGSGTEKRFPLENLKKEKP